MAMFTKQFVFCSFFGVFRARKAAESLTRRRGEEKRREKKGENRR
jgi:hypothetical protein